MNTESAEIILQYQLDWIRAVDSKVPQVYAINLAMLGAVAALTENIQTWPWYQVTIIALTILSCVISIGFIAVAIFPKISGPSESNIFFMGIVQDDEDTFKKSVYDNGEAGHLDDCLNQIYRNASIATEKYQQMKQAFVFMGISFPLWLVSVFLLTGQ
jgi:hypothetical protein